MGSAILIPGRQGATYKFIKMNNSTWNNDGSGDTYWMLADNICSLSNTKGHCVNNPSGSPSNYGQYWNPTSDGVRSNNWTTMSMTQHGVYSQVQ